MAIMPRRSIGKSASAGNRTRVTSMATMYSTTRPLMLLREFHFRTILAALTRGESNSEHSLHPFCIVRTIRCLASGTPPFFIIHAENIGGPRNACAPTFQHQIHMGLILRAHMPTEERRLHSSIFNVTSQLVRVVCLKPQVPWTPWARVPWLAMMP